MFSERGGFMLFHRPLICRVYSWVLAILCGTSWCFGQVEVAAPPVSKQDRQQMAVLLRERAEQLTHKLLDAGSQRGELLSQRGDVWFFLGEFTKSVADYEAMVEIDPQQGDSHWRRGIARFYGGKAKEAAQQFEAYHSFDDIDRENGIWRYFSQYRAYGPAKAKEGLLKYRKTDREPFPDVYRLFSDDTTPQEILAAIDKADISRDEREKRLFYAQLYIGLNHAVEGRDSEAITHLRESTANSWGPEAGYGPRYMWHVGRVNLNLLLAKQQKPDDTVGSENKSPAVPKPAASPGNGS
jgi:lipoprotein NlpI